MRRNLSALLVSLGLLSSAFAQSPSIDTALRGKTSREKATIKAERIVGSNPKGTYNHPSGVRVEIESIAGIAGGVELYARAWKGGKRVGFGDGSVEIERFRFINPPVLVPDANGDVVRNYTEKGQVIFTRTLREDPKEAIREVLAQTVQLVAKDDGAIVDGKVGHTVTTVFPEATGGSTSGDGRSTNDNKATWALARDAADGTAASDNDASLFTGFSGEDAGGTNYTISRAFYTLDTSSIPDTDVVSSAIFSLFGNAKINTDNDGQDYINVYASTQASNTTVSTADFDQCGTTAYATSIDLGVISTTGYNDWTLNGTGIAAVSLTGVSKFCVREGHDAENAPIANNTANRLAAYFADQAGTTNDPKLVVTHAAPAAPSAPSWRKMPPGGGDIQFN